MNILRTSHIILHCNLWSSGDIPGFLIGVWTLGYNGCCSLLLGTSPTVVLLLLLGIFLGGTIYISLICVGEPRG